MKPPRLVFPGCVLLVCLWTSCGRTLGSEASASSSYDDAAVREAEKVMEGMKMRPDVLVMAFIFRQEGEGMGPAVPKLKAAVDRWVRTTAEASKAEVSVRMRGFYQESGKRMGGTQVVVHGLLDVAMPESLDFWGRAALVATLVEVANKEDAALEKANTGLHASFSLPAAYMRDPEAHRAGLMKRWVERARGFISQAQSEQAPLQLAGCEPPGAVKQQPVSVDEVVLSLAVGCRLDAVTK